MEKKKSIKFNFIMNAILSVSNIIFPIITIPYLTEIIKPEGTGKIGFAISLVEYFNIFAQLGIPTYGIRACAQVRDDKEKLTKTAQELLLINIFMTVITYIVFILAILSIWGLRTKNTTLFGVVSISLTTMVMFPLMFFANAGLTGGMAFYFLIAPVCIAIVLILLNHLMKQNSL